MVRLLKGGASRNGLCRFRVERIAVCSSGGVLFGKQVRLGRSWLTEVGILWHGVGVGELDRDGGFVSLVL